jgi:hypothetical protein
MKVLSGITTTAFAFLALILKRGLIGGLGAPGSQPQ